MRNSGLSVESLIQYTSLYQLGDVTLDDRKSILVNERAKLIEKYEELGTTIKRLDRKIEDYDNGKMRQSEKRLSDWKETNHS